jgi:hypothetical protein
MHRVLPDSGAAPASTRVRGCTQPHEQSCGACLERFFEPLTAAAAPAPDMATAKMIAHSTARPPQKHRRSDMRDARHAEAARPKPTTVNRRAPDKTLTPVSQHQGAMAGAPGRNAVVAARPPRGHSAMARPANHPDTSPPSTDGTHFILGTSPRARPPFPSAHTGHDAPSTPSARWRNRAPAGAPLHRHRVDASPDSLDAHSRHGCPPFAPTPGRVRELRHSPWRSRNALSAHVVAREPQRFRP